MSKKRKRAQASQRSQVSSLQHQWEMEQKRIDRVRGEFRAEDLIKICQMDGKDFGEYAERFDLEPRATWHGREMSDRYYYYKDNGSNLLFVAHLDSVQYDRTTTVIDTADGPLVVSPVLDDRLGAYVGLELLPRLGIEADILLTTNEEMGASTASDFDTDKQYHWMYEFDRGGTDVVLYQYDTAKHRQLVSASGARVSMGSYSDIADLEHLGCAGFNWGVGYEDYHSTRSHAWLEDTFKMVAKFTRFHAANEATLLPFESWEKEIVDDSMACPRCDSELDRWGICHTCGYDWLDREDDVKIEDDDDEPSIIVPSRAASNGSNYPMVL